MTSSWQFPRNVLEVLQKLFADTRARRVEHMLLLLGSEAEAKVTHFLEVDHIVTGTSCEISGDGFLQILHFCEEHPELQLLGWLHSHHVLQGVPSKIDVQNHVSQQAAGGFRLLAIYFDASSVESIPGLRIWELRNPDQSCQIDFDEIEPLSLLKGMVWSEGEWDVSLHKNGS